MKALILAGGLGSELLPLTINTAKPLLPVGNLPLLLFQIDQLKKAGITEVVLSLSYPPRMIRHRFDDGSNFGVLLRYHVESTPVGTAGALQDARDLLDETTIVINGDVLSAIPVSECLEAHRRTGAVVTIATCSVANPRAYGLVEVDQAGRVVGFTERPRGKAVRDNTINAGVYVVEQAVLEWIPKGQPFFFERDLFPFLLKVRAPFFATQKGQYWREITRPYNYLLSNMDLLDGRLRAPQFPAMLKANHRPKGADILVDAASLIDEQCMIKSGAQIIHSVVGCNCRIEEGAVVRNSVLWPGCRIQRDAFVSGSILGRGCLVGVGARVHPGNILGDKSCVTSYSRT